MKRGKQTCRILKDIRRQIAEANDIEFITSECQYQGDCPGTCPKCEAEVRYLEQQLERRRIAGKAITVLGISAGLVAISPMTSCSNSGNKSTNQEVTSDTVSSETLLIGEPTVVGEPDISYEDTVAVSVENEPPPPPPPPTPVGIVEIITGDVITLVDNDTIESVNDTIESANDTIESK